jgi:hypothetical protein
MTSTTPKHPADAIPDEMVLAAIDRAARHRARDHADVPGWAITEHLGIGRRSAAARHVRSLLAALLEAGRLERSRRHGIPVWALTRSRRRHLERASRSGSVPALPESPQHRRWRDAQTLAEQEIERFRQALQTSIDEAVQMLDSRPVVSSDAWLELSEQLRRDTWRVGSATYCLHEWVEPHDEQADVDDRRDPDDYKLAAAERARRKSWRAGRRNLRLWQDNDTQ